MSHFESFKLFVTAEVILQFCWSMQSYRLDIYYLTFYRMILYYYTTVLLDLKKTPTYKVSYCVSKSHDEKWSLMCVFKVPTSRIFNKGWLCQPVLWFFKNCFSVLKFSDMEMSLLITYCHAIIFVCLSIRRS